MTVKVAKGVQSQSIIYDVPIYCQDDLQLCWAFCQLMITDYYSGIVRTNSNATDEAINIAIQVNKAAGVEDKDTWDQPNNPENISTAIDINSIEVLYKFLLEFGPIYASYTDRPNNVHPSVKGYNDHIIIVTGVDLATGCVYTNNPWGKKGMQSFNDFFNHLVGEEEKPDSGDWCIDQFYLIIPQGGIL